MSFGKHHRWRQHSQHQVVKAFLKIKTIYFRANWPQNKVRPCLTSRFGFKKETSTFQRLSRAYISTLKITLACQPRCIYRFDNRSEARLEIFVRALWTTGWVCKGFIFNSSSSPSKVEFDSPTMSVLKMIPGWHHPYTFNVSMRKQ